MKVIQYRTQDEQEQRKIVTILVVDTKEDVFGIRSMFRRYPSTLVTVLPTTEQKEKIDRAACALLLSVTGRAENA